MSAHLMILILITRSGDNENNNLFNDNNLNNNNFFNDNLNQNFTSNQIALNNQNLNVNMNANVNAGQGPAVGGSPRNSGLMQGDLIGEHKDAVKLFLEEGIVEEREKIQCNYQLYQSSGVAKKYTLGTKRNRLEFRLLQREPTADEVGEHR